MWALDVIGLFTFETFERAITDSTKLARLPSFHVQDGVERRHLGGDYVTFSSPITEAATLDRHVCGSCRRC